MEQEVSTPEDSTSQHENFSFKENKVLNQQINFYLLLPKKTTSVLNQKIVITSYAGFFLIFVLFFLLFSLQEKKLKIQATGLDEIVASRQAALHKLTSSYPITNMEDLRKALQDTQTDYQDKVVSMDTLSLSANFSKYLIALSGATIEGVWLKEIDFNKTGSKIILKGVSLQHPLVEQYLTQLGAQQGFKGLSFELQELAETTTPATFLITTKSD